MTTSPGRGNRGRAHDRRGSRPQASASRSSPPIAEPPRRRRPLAIFIARGREVHQPDGAGTIELRHLGGDPLLGEDARKIPDGFHKTRSAWRPGRPPPCCRRDPMASRAKRVTLRWHPPGDVEAGRFWARLVSFGHVCGRHYHCPNGSSRAQNEREMRLHGLSAIRSRLINVKRGTNVRGPASSPSGICSGSRRPQWWPGWRRGS